MVVDYIVWPFCLPFWQNRNYTFKPYKGNIYCSATALHCAVLNCKGNLVSVSTPCILTISTVCAAILRYSMCQLFGKYNLQM